ncbi:hypothetical protein POM88_049391 [Heracleum sosnowskyi]|uniref:Uncharacterized protein n=1 Tax=Heracleum sosnowskyi TaxID=360622 RepID=A0AAD8GVH8_9APIA|nr:hypothetical protein POM88_049391 [Heracleum sosnowskyi]
MSSIVKRITQSRNANKENRYETSQISHNYTKGRYAPLMSNNNKNDVNSSISDIAVGVGCTSIRPPFSVLTTRQPFSNISNQVNGIAGDAVFKSPDLSCVTTRIPLSNISNSRLNLHEKGCVDTMDENISATNEYISERNSPIDGIHHLFGGDSVFKSPDLSCVTTRIPLSNISNSRLNLNEKGCVDTMDENISATNENISDVTSGQTEFVEEDAEMFYDGELLDGSDSDEEDIMSGHKSSLTKEGIKMKLLIGYRIEMYQSQTIFDQSGFPIYKRRKTGITVKKGKDELDNQYVVPYNRNLLVKYQCHMNVEICCHSRSLKYLFKYCLKGHDRSIVEVSSSNKETDSAENPPIDEIQAYFDGRYICGAESAYRIFGFDVHYRSISVLRLSFHLPGKKNCTFRENEELHKVVEREKWRRSQLEAFFNLNQQDRNARNYTYDEIPRYYVCLE